MSLRSCGPKGAATVRGISPRGQARAGPTTDTWEIIHRANHCITQGMGMIKMVKSTATSVRHKMESPDAVNSNSAVPRTFRQIHCIMNFATHAQPMIVMNDRPNRIFHPM
jgi:hypothetical protein